MSAMASLSLCSEARFVGEGWVREGAGNVPKCCLPFVPISFYSRRRTHRDVVLVMIGVVASIEGVRDFVVVIVVPSFSFLCWRS